MERIKSCEGQLANELLESVLDQNGNEGIDLNFSFEGTGNTESITGGCSSNNNNNGGGSNSINMTPVNLHGVGVFSPSNISRNNSASTLSSFSLNSNGGNSSSSSSLASNNVSANSSLIYPSQPSQILCSPQTTSIFTNNTPINSSSSTSNRNIENNACSSSSSTNSQIQQVDEDSRTPVRKRQRRKI
ncbi:hypothetical protein Mgra_00002151 [Meloidogyne graminicola]|uniref:Uncharacterized protein n=1 Tax=Meloidogyne graminicola TaxID=189291 RepID=A0A8S9ZYS9_9BILA|nr:hypothetical protein Mgra_00002151 [Meloidogyne graminicola]